MCELVCEQESMCVRMCECAWWGKGKFPGYRDKGWLDPRVSPTKVRGHDFVVIQTATTVSFQESRRWVTG